MNEGQQLLSSVALAHTADSFGKAASFGWSFDLAVAIPLILAGALYGAGVARLWRRAGTGRGARPYQIGCFAAGWLTLAAALVSPLHEASETVFTAHMIEHELIMVCAAPLLVLARPLAPMLWALPPGWRRGLGHVAKLGWFSAVWRTLTMPLVATVLHGLAIWLWHAPPLFDAALESEPLHWLQHACFLFSALLFWWALFFSPASRRSYGPAIGHLFATAGHTGFLGLLLLLSRQLWFPVQSTGSAWNLTPIEDQQLAGLVMWIPAGFIYTGAALVLAGLWISASGRRGHMGHAAASRCWRSAAVPAVPGHFPRICPTGNRAPIAQFGNSRRSAMIDRAKNTDNQGDARPNTPGAGKREEAPDIDDGERTVAPGSPNVGDKLNDEKEQLSDTPSHRASGAPDSPKAANRVDNRRSKKFRAP